MRLQRFICELELCSVSFYDMAGVSRHYCSRECYLTAKVLRWARQMAEMKKEGATYQEIGDKLGISKSAASSRWSNLMLVSVKNLPLVAEAIGDLL